MTGYMTSSEQFEQLAVCVIIPTYNEKENVERMIRKLEL